MIYDVIIIGAGASGLFCAANLRGLCVAILEKNSSAGKKILASGGGRCNITNRNLSVANYHFTGVAGAQLVRSALSALKFSDVLRFFDKLKFIEQKNAQFFCDSGAKDVLGVLLTRAQESGAQIFYGTEVIKASLNTNVNSQCGINLDSSQAADVNLASKFSSKIFEITAANGQKFYSRNLVVACGAPSYKALGASETALKIAADFGLKFSKFTPALVGLTVQKDEFWFKNLSGVSLRARVRVLSASKRDLASFGTSKQADLSNLDSSCGGTGKFDASARYFSQPDEHDSNKTSLNLTDTGKLNFNAMHANFKDDKFDLAAGFNGSLSSANNAKFQSGSAREFDADVLFTHKGISGPAILNASLFWQKGLIEINFAPELTDTILAKSKPNLKQKNLNKTATSSRSKNANFSLNLSDEAILYELKKQLTQGKKQLSSVLLLPRRFTLEFLRAKGLADRAFNAYSVQEQEQILQLFSYRFAPAGTFGFEKAEASRGGVSADELCEDFQSQRVRGLFVIGEATEVTGMVGGYNLHFAFASALKCALSLTRFK